MPATPATYATLRRAVEAVVLQGRREIDQAWLATYHEAGLLINEHLLLNKDRAGYGAQVFERLATDTGIGSRTLHECSQFHRCFPIMRTCAQLGWAQCRLLCQVGDPAQRKVLLREAVKQGWTVAQLAERVRPLNTRDDTPAITDPAASPTTEPPKTLTPKRGTPGVCKVVAAGDRLAADLGFATYHDLPEGTALKAGDLVRLDSAGRATVAGGATKADLFTYAAAVLKVVDGDTLWVQVYLDARRWVKQKLRLRDLDCPEIDTAEGKAAKRFVESLVARATAVTICTTKPDKYDRYLADVFLELAKDSVSQLSSLNFQPRTAPVFLNNALLENGHAVVKRAWEFADWGE